LPRKAGERLGPYEILGLIGAGGMGEVYKAKDTRLGRTVAIKVLPNDISADPERRARFEREARALAALSHPHIVTIYSVEEVGGFPFLTMELVEGRALRHLIPPAGMALDRFLEIAVALADALGAAHDRGVLHRDLKPENVMVTREGRVKVLDFGLAKVREQPDADLNQVPTATLEALTREGGILGTVPYMSPEQIRGKSADARSDLFSLGVVLYQMATGRRPFRGEGAAEILSSILRDDPASTSDVRPELPRRLGRILRRCLAKDPEGRFQSAKDLRNELEDLREEVIEARLIQPKPRPRRFGRRHALAAGAVLIPLMLAALALFGIRHYVARGGAGGAADRETPAAMLAVIPFENLGLPEDEYFADGITEEIGARLARIAGLGVIARTSTIGYKGSRKGAREIGEELGVEYILEGTVRWEQLPGEMSRVRVMPQLVRTSDATRLWSDVYEEPLAGVFRLQAAIAERVADAMDLTLGEAERAPLRAVPTNDLVAYDYYLRGNESLLRGNRREDYELAVQMYGGAVGKDPSFALAHARLSRAHAGMYWFHFDRSDERRVLAKAAVDIALALEPTLPEARLALAYYHYWLHLDYDRALAELEHARAGMPGDAAVPLAAAAIQRRQGRWSEAIDSFRRAARLNPRSATVIAALASTLWLVREYEESRRYLEHALLLTPEWGLLYSYLAHVHVAVDGSTRTAREVLDEASRVHNLSADSDVLHGQLLLDLLDRDFEGLLKRLEHIKQAVVLDDPHVFQSTDLYRAYAYRGLGRVELARDHFQIARSLLAQEIRRRPEDSRLHSVLGLACAGLGLRDEAIGAGRQGVELMPIERDAFAGTVRVAQLTQIYTMLGEYDGAIEQLELLLSVPSTLSVSHLRLDPAWDPLRDRPGFRRLLETR
jgi:eukaryotic-like serine/threonine-protein kinase